MPRALTYTALTENIVHNSLSIWRVKTQNHIGKQTVDTLFELQSWNNMSPVNCYLFKKFCISLSLRLKNTESNPRLEGWDGKSRDDTLWESEWIDNSTWNSEIMWYKNTYSEHELLLIR